MRHLMLRSRVLIAGAVLVLWGASAADSITITRIGSCDWICADADFVQLSCHQRLDKAVEACANRALASGEDHHISGAQYRVGATRDAIPQTGSITLSWTAPTHNEDGTLATDLAGFKIYLGEVSGEYTQSFNIPEPDRTSVVLDNVPVGTYYISATAYNSQGEESRYAVEVIEETQ